MVFNDDFVRFFLSENIITAQNKYDLFDKAAQLDEEGKCEESIVVYEQILATATGMTPASNENIKVESKYSKAIQNLKINFISRCNIHLRVSIVRGRRDSR